MKIIVAACAALFLSVSACNHEDTNAGGVWGRTVEPRLTTTHSWSSCTRKLSPGHVVVDAQCAATPITEGRCDAVGTHQEANRMLVSQLQCTDAAVAVLEALSRKDNAAMSDLAAAYYVRAQRNDDPADLLKAFDAVQSALKATPQPSGAQFNLALILEALSLNAEAIDAWKRAAAEEEGRWREEALAHRARLLAKTDRWPQVRAQIDAALVAHDVAQTQRLIAEYPASAQKHFEEDVLPHSESARIETFGQALSQFFKDRYFIDVAAASSRAREGHVRFAEARAAEAALNAKAAAPLYKEAAELLRRAGSPQFLLARIAHAGQNAVVTEHYEPSLQELDAVAGEARPYPSVLARAEMGRLHPYQYLDRYNELFATADAVMRTYGRLGDWEDRAAANARKISAMTVVGLNEQAWREAFAVMSDALRAQDLKTRHILIGTAARAALNRGHAEAALRYQTILVNTVPPEHLSIALYHRAAIELCLRDYAGVQRDIDAAIRANQGDESVRQAFEARIAEVEGERSLPRDPKRAVEQFTRAIGLAAKAEYATFRANLLAERAEAYRLMGKPAEAERDMRDALNELHGEENKQLRERTPGGRSDDLWTAYFSRFQDTYDSLIRQLIAGGKVGDAFLYAERARAYEPLDLVRKLPAAPAEFRALAAHPDVAKLQALLPSDTFLIEYRVFDDQTYAWVVGRDVFAGRWLKKATPSDVQRWTETLQKAASEKNSAVFEDGLVAPFGGLLEEPLDVIHRTGVNLVIIPDRKLRGLPFCALRNPDTKHYLIEDYVPSVSGSALLYVFALLRDRAMTARDASALLIGDPAFDKNSPLAQGLDRLRFARGEIEAIRGLYPSEVLMDDAATPQQFLSRAGSHAIIHVAAHGVVNPDTPSQSYLLFHDLLNASMLMSQLHTDKTRLVVLGACSSAGGLPVGAEGIAPLVRPIVGAGVPGVVGALWDIDDATASHLLVSFHQDYRRGKDAAKALRDAQLTMLHSGKPGQAPARFWAPFQAIGYASSPFAPVENTTKEKPP